LKKLLIILLLLPIFTSFCWGETAAALRAESVKNFKEAQQCYGETSKSERWEEALECAKYSLELGEILFDRKQKNLAALYHNYGLMLAKNGNYNDSFYALSEALNLYEDIYGPDSENVGWLLVDLAEGAPQQLRLHSFSYKTYKKALTIFSQKKYYRPLTYAEIALRASSRLSGMGLTPKSLKWAIDIAEHAHAIFAEELGTDSYKASMAAFTLGKLKYFKEDYSGAIGMLEKSLANKNFEILANSLLVKIYIQTDRPEMEDKHAQMLLKSSYAINNKYKPVFVGIHSYPVKAEKHGIQGCGVISLIITKTGGIRDPNVIEESPKSWGFGKAAMEVASKLRYSPQFVDGEAQEVSDVLYKFTFNMAQ